MKYKVGDVVRTIKDYNQYGHLLFPIGTIGLIVEVKESRTHPYEVEANGDTWFYTQDMLGLVSTEKTYEQGLNDAWELAKKIAMEKYNGGFDVEELVGIFSYNDMDEVFMSYTPQEALAKLKAYEERIEVGDVVVHGGDTVFVVTKIDKMIMGYDKIGNAHSFCFPNQLIKKTGKHIDITSILEQIREV